MSGSLFSTDPSSDGSALRGYVSGWVEESDITVEPRLSGPQLSGRSIIRTRHIELRYYYYYSASSLKRPLEVVTFLHRLYLPKLVHVARFYFHAQSTTTLNQNLCKRVLTALSQCQLILSGHFLVTSQALSFQSWHFVAHSKQMTSVFWESLVDQICRWANQISRVESCFYMRDSHAALKVSSTNKKAM